MRKLLSMKKLCMDIQSNLPKLMQLVGRAGIQINKPVWLQILSFRTLSATLEYESVILHRLIYKYNLILVRKIRNSNGIEAKE